MQNAVRRASSDVLVPVPSLSRFSTSEESFPPLSPSWFYHLLLGADNIMPRKLESTARKKVIGGDFLFGHTSYS